MAFGAVRHTARRVKTAFWRGFGARKTNVTIRVEIGRSLRQRLPWLEKRPVTTHGAGFSARACITGGKERRCTYAEGRSPTLAFKAAVNKLIKRTR